MIAGEAKLEKIFRVSASGWIYPDAETENVQDVLPGLLRQKPADRKKFSGKQQENAAPSISPLLPSDIRKQKLHSFHSR